MCWRQVTKLKKTLLIVLFYFVIYNLVSYAMFLERPITFIQDELSVGNKYAFMYLISDRRAPVFLDAEGSQPFATRRCSGCFITNNKDFLPMREYDAILVHGDKKLLAASEAAMDPEKRFLIETSHRCVRRKLRSCSWEPRLTAFVSRESFDLCGLCRHLLARRRTGALLAPPV